MAGANDWETAKIEELADGVADLVEKMKPWIMENDPEKKKALMTKISDEHIKPHLDLYCKLLTANGTGYFVGSKV